MKSFGTLLSYIHSTKPTDQTDEPSVERKLWYEMITEYTLGGGSIRTKHQKEIQQRRDSQGSMVSKYTDATQVKEGGFVTRNVCF